MHNKFEVKEQRQRSVRCIVMYFKVWVWFISVVLHACFVSSLLVSSAAGLSVGENISGICCNSIQEGKTKSWVLQIPVGCKRKCFVFLLMCARVCVWGCLFTGLGLGKYMCVSFILSYKARKVEWIESSTGSCSLFYSFLLRPGSQSLSSCCRRCSGSTTVTGWPQSRRALSRTASRCSPMSVRSRSLSTCIDSWKKPSLTSPYF